MNNDEKEEDEGIKNILTLFLSVIVGALISLYIHNKYGPNIFETLQTETILDILFTTLLYLFLFSFFIIIIWLLIKFIIFIIKLYLEPIKVFYDYIKKKSKILKKIEKNTPIDLEPLYKKNPYFFKFALLIMITVFIIYRFHFWLRSNINIYLTIFIGIYIIICLIYFIIKSIKGANE